MGKAFFLATIDTECDKCHDWSVQWPLSFNAVCSTLPQRLEPVFRKYGVRPTYLLSPEVVRDSAAAEVLRDAQRCGAELGTHLHGEFVEPHAETKPRATNQMQNTYSSELEFAKLLRLTEEFQQHFGMAPRSFRAGRFGMSRHTLGHLERLGYCVDSSVAPLMSWVDTGGSIEFFGVPDQPYYPGREDYKCKGNCRVLEVPVTIANSWYNILPQFFVRRVPRLEPWWGRLLKYGGLSAAFMPLWLRPTFRAGTVANLSRLVALFLDKQEAGPVFLVMMFHNVDFEPGCSPYSRNEAQTAEFIARLDGILAYARQRGCEFITLQQVPEKLRAN